MLHPQSLFNIVVKRIQQPYSCNLHHLAAGIVPGFSGILVVQHAADAAQHLAAYIITKHPFYTFVLHARIISMNVCLQKPAVQPMLAVEPPHVSLPAFNSVVRALANLARAVIRYKAFGYRRVQFVVIQASLVYAVSERYAQSLPLFGVGNQDRFRRSVLPCTVFQLFFHPQYIFQVI